jgi:L-fucose isomerase-like protein
MSDRKRVKIGLVGFMTNPFRGPKETYFSEDARALDSIAQKREADVIVFEKGVYDLATARQAAQEFQREEVDLVLIQASSFSGGSFIYPFLAIEAHIALWAIPEGEPTKEGGLPLNSFTAMNMYNSLIKTRTDKKKEPIQWFFGRAREEQFIERFDALVRALYTAINLKGARVALIGGVAPGFDNLIIDPEKLQKKTGVQLVEFELEHIYALADSLSDTERINRYYQRMIDQSRTYSANMEEYFQETARFQAAFHLLVEENELDAAAVSCWPQFQTDRHLGVCTLLGQLNDDSIVTACEGDIPGALGMLSLHLLSLGKITTIMDMVTIDPADDSVLLWHCGPTAPSLSDENGVAMQSLWLYDSDPHAPLGLHNNLRLKPGPATVLGFHPDFEHFLTFEGTLDNKKPSYVGSSAWMRDFHMDGKPAGCLDIVQTIMESGYQHHYPLVYGSYEKAAHDLARLLEITKFNGSSY